MKALGLMPAAIAALLLALTYLVVQGGAPEAALHERTLGAFRAIHLDHAALDRDLLRARAGLLRNYDPLVAHFEGLSRAVATLRQAGAAITEEAGAPIRAQIEQVAAAVAVEEERVEAFKSRNALLRNSLSYFSHTTRELAQFSADTPGGAAVAGALGIAMLRFLATPQDAYAAEVRDALAALRQMPLAQPAAEKAEALSAHGAIILATLPALDAIVRDLLSPDLADRARVAQDAYLAWHAKTAARASVVRLLLYAASVLLALYLGYLILRLRRNARALQARLGFERQIAALSAQFINLPQERLGRAVAEALGRLADLADFDRARIVLHGGEPDDERLYTWQRGDLDPAAASGAAQEVKTRLSVPLGPGGELGTLTFDAVGRRRRWSEGDVAMLRMAGEIFANAIARGRTEREHERLEAQLHQAQRLEAIGTLAGGIAHEFNNVLGGILGYAEMLQNALPHGGRPRHHVEQVMNAARRAQGIVDQILDFSRRSERRHQPFALQPALNEALEFLRVSLPTTIELKVDLAAEDAVVVGDRGQLQQVLINLCTNAAHASGGRGVIDVALAPLTVSGGRALSHGKLPPGSYLRLAVRDRGHGIDGATMARIFEPFFTTKAVGAGTGLGLSTAHGIVAQHGGGLNVISRPGEGSTFEVYLPQARASVSPEGEVEAPLVRGEGETVLIVDDERPLMLLGEEMLAALGYEPVGFDAAPAALAAFRTDPDRFDLVLADEVMPAMTGTELAAALHAVRPDIPVVIMTGYSGPIAVRRLRAAGVREVLKKPLLSADIADCLARQLRPQARVRSAR